MEESVKEWIVEGIVFDVYKTLASRIMSDFDKLASLLPRGSKPLSEEKKRAGETASRDYYFQERHKAWAMADIHRFWREYYRRSIEAMHIPDSQQKLAEALAEWARLTDSYCVTDGAFETMAELKRRGYRVGMLSNFDTSLTKFCRELGFDDRHTDMVLASDEIGIRKPAIEIFLEGSRRIGVAPSRLLFVGDSLIKDVSGAMTAGMLAIWYNPRSKSLPPETVHHPVFTIKNLPDLLPALPRQALFQL